MKSRKSISKKLRFEVFKRDNFKCGYCGKTISENVILEVDHIIPVSKGGENNILNLMTSCFDCNRGKSKNLLSNKNDLSKNNIERFSKIKEHKEQINAYLKFILHKEKVLDEICSLAIKPMIELGNCDLPTGWKNSVKYFINKIGFVDVYKSSQITLSKNKVYSNKKFNYFCGICHLKIKQLEQNVTH